MSLDFLRALAFSGDLSRFFREDPFGLEGNGANGIQLRFDDDFMKAAFYNVYSTPKDDISNSYQGRPVNAEVSDHINLIWRDVFSPTELRQRGLHSLAHWLEEHGQDKRKAIIVLVDVEDPEHWLLRDGPNNYEGFRIEYRSAGPIQPQYAAGDSIKVVPTGERGTICGFLCDTVAKTRYGLTCGHVGRMKGAVIDDGGGTNPFQLGTIDNVIIPSATGPCNRCVQPIANGIDASLIMVDANAVINAGSHRIVSPISSITQGDLVEFRGRGSRRQRRAQVLSATIWKQIDLLKTKTMYCCGDIFEIGHRGWVYFNSNLSQPGDSGAAVLRPGQPDEWFGMLIGGHGSSSYVTYAEHIMDWTAGIYPNIRLMP